MTAPTSIANLDQIADEKGGLTLAQDAKRGGPPPFKWSHLWEQPIVSQFTKFSEEEADSSPGKPPQCKILHPPDIQPEQPVLAVVPSVLA
jgi:hypothetical protein